MSLTVWSSARFTFPLSHDHRFPLGKYALLRDRLISEGIVGEENVLEPEGATDTELTLVHAPDYVHRFTHGLLTPHEVRRLGFPWSPELVERSRRAVGGTVAAARHALLHGIAMNLAGGTHHAFADHGEGFCVFNDVAVAIRLLQRVTPKLRAAVIDLDVHQGNGTHSLFSDDASVFTFSMHGRRNYPFRKVPGSLDVELDDGTGDEEYLMVLQEAMPRVLAAAAPDIVFYIAGADPHEGDSIGRLAITFNGLARRDSYVLEQCREVGLPVAIVIGGGYGRDIHDTVAVHVTTARIAAGFA